MNQWVPVTVGHNPPVPARHDMALEKNWESKGDPKEPHTAAGPGFRDLDIWLSGSGFQDFDKQTLGFRTSINGHWVPAPRQTHARNKRNYIYDDSKLLTPIYNGAINCT